MPGMPFGREKATDATSQNVFVRVLQLTNLFLGLCDVVFSQEKMIPELGVGRPAFTPAPPSGHAKPLPRPATRDDPTTNPSKKIIGAVTWISPQLQPHSAHSWDQLGCM